MAAMSTPVGHSRLQPLHDTHSASVSYSSRDVESVGPELAGEREPQRVGAAARHVALVARHAVRRAHRAGVELAAVAVVVAHLDGGGETAAAILGADFVLRPVEPRRERATWR